MVYIKIEIMKKLFITALLVGVSYALSAQVKIENGELINDKRVVKEVLEILAKYHHMRLKINETTNVLQDHLTCDLPINNLSICLHILHKVTGIDCYIKRDIIYVGRKKRFL